MNRFNPASFMKGDWFTSDEVNEIEFPLQLPSEFSAMVPVLRDIDRIVTGASQSSEGKLSQPQIDELAASFDKLAALTDGDNAEDLHIKADALRNGYTPDKITRLNALDSTISFVGGNISSWYGKQPGGFATCFACSKRPDLTSVCDAVGSFEAATQKFLGSISKRINLSEIPKFAVCDLVYMVGEGAGHPKHIAYFLPEDEGFKCSPVKKTHYLSNIHLAQMQRISEPFLNTHTSFNYDNVDKASLGALGVLGHEFGHFVTLPETDFRAVSSWNRWASIMYQEIAADVFGFLLLAEWGPLLGHSLEACCKYYFGELLRYVHRGFGKFPDSDGMMFQFNYLREFSAVTFSDDQLTFEVSSPEAVVVAMRSLARILVESLFKNDTYLLEEFAKKFGIDAEATNEISQFLLRINASPLSSLAYRNAAI